MKHFSILVTSVCCLAVPTHTGVAQTVFAWPDGKVNLSGYHYLDNCVAAGSRVWDSVRSAQKVLSDTVFYARGRVGAETPTKVASSLRECLAKFAPTQIPRDYTVMAQKTYLQAGQFADAEAAVTYGLSQIPATDTASRTALADSILEVYAKTPPFQFDRVQAYIDTLKRYGAAYRPWNLFRDYFWLMHAAWVAGEDSLAVRAGRRVFEMAPAAAKSAKGGELAAVGVGVLWAMRIVRGQELLDSLKKGNAEYAALWTAEYRKAMGFVPSEQVRDVDAPVLQGDYWFPSTAATEEYPRKGRVSLVVFLQDRVSGGDGPVIMLSRLRRWQKKYPTVDIILVTNTVGAFGPLEPPSPEREAFLADSVFRNFHRLNPVLSVTKGSYVQFDAPDDRRFYQPYPNLEAYPGRGIDLYRNGKTGKFFLIDDQRRIVDAISFTEDEGWQMRLIETLLARMAGGSSQ